MVLLTILAKLSIILSLSFRVAAVDISDVCNDISSSISDASEVFWPGDKEYDQDIAHFSPSASIESVCTVEPGNAADTGIILQIIGANRTPFGIKSGGHSYNPGFSSTEGVLVSTVRLKDLHYQPYNSSSPSGAVGTVELGAGLIWDEVYLALEPYNVTVVGGRVPGIGVSGFTLGGGYSWKTNQHGLSLDTVTALELVIPSGEAVTVTHESDEELFFALRGGGNDFGIVTKLTLEVFPQVTDVWGGVNVYNASEADSIKTALFKYLDEYVDPKSGLGWRYVVTEGETTIIVNVFYDAPTPPDGLFDAFFAIPAMSSDVATRSYISLVATGTGGGGTEGTSGILSTVAHVAATERFIDEIVREAEFYGTQYLNESLSVASYGIEPFLPSSYHPPGFVESAYPPNRNETLWPMVINFSWTNSTPSVDNLMFSLTRETTGHIIQVAQEEGIFAPNAQYPNYAILGTDAAEIFGGQEGVERLRNIAGRVDPEGVMNLTGGWKL